VTLNGCRASIETERVSTSGSEADLERIVILRLECNGEATQPDYLTALADRNRWSFIQGIEAKTVCRLAGGAIGRI